MKDTSCISQWIGHEYEVKESLPGSGEVVWTLHKCIHCGHEKTSVSKWG